MRFFITFILFCSQIFAFELVLNTGQENGNKFGILHVKNDTPFTCFKANTTGLPRFECEIAGVVQNDFDNKNFDFFNLEFVKNEKSIKLIIHSKMPAKVFDLSQNIYIDKSLSANENSTSMAFDFIFYEKFLNQKESDGLNFDVEFPHQDLPFVGALDLNSNPVLIPQSADINTYIRIKNDYAKNAFNQVEIDANNAIARYKNSIFMSEFILYKLRAQDKIYNNSAAVKDAQVLDQIIQSAKEFSRTYTSDKNFPEVLYIMMKTYMSLNQRSDVDYVMSILENEQKDSVFTQLARLDYGDYIYNLGEKEIAVRIYENIYYNTQNKDLAAKAAMSLARDLLEKNDLLKASEYMNKIFNANAQYLNEERQNALLLARMFYDKEAYDMSAAIYDILFEKTPKIDNDYEEILKNYILALSKSSDPARAKAYVDAYLDNFVDGLYVKMMQKVDDEIFFAMPDTNSTYLHQRYQELMKKYEKDDEEISKKALEADINLYYKDGDFDAVANYKDKIEQMKLDGANRLLEDVAIKSLNRHLSEDNCIVSVEVFNKFAAFDVGQKINDKKKMLQCFLRTSNTNAAIDYIDKNLNDDSIFYMLEKANLMQENKNYRETIKLAQNILNTRILKSDEEQFRALYLSFLANLKLNNYNEAINILQRLEKYPMNYAMVEAYDTLVSYANDHNMPTSILTYAPKAIDFQNLKGINLFSPNLEFIYVDNLQKINDNAKALEILLDVLKLKLNDEDRARALYMQALSYEALNDEANLKQSLNLCINLATNSQWRNLCQDKNALLGN